MRRLQRVTAHWSRASQRFPGVRQVAVTAVCRQDEPAIARRRTRDTFTDCAGAAPCRQLPKRCQPVGIKNRRFSLPVPLPAPRARRDQTPESLSNDLSGEESCRSRRKTPHGLAEAIPSFATDPPFGTDDGAKFDGHSRLKKYQRQRLAGISSTIDRYPTPRMRAPG